MKKIVLLLALVIVSCTGKEPVGDGFVVKGKFSKIEGPVMVKLNYTDDKNNHIFDEIVSENGEFIFKGNTTASGAVLFFVPYHPNYANTTKEYWDFATKEMLKKCYQGSRSFFLESGTFEFTGEDDMVNAKLETESGNQELYSVYNKKLQLLKDKYFDLSEKRVQDSTSGNTAEAAWTENKILQQQIKISDFAYEFAKEHPQSKVSLAALKGDGVNINTDKLGPAVDNLSKALQSTPVVKAFRKLLVTANRNKLGNEAIDFALEDPSGNKKSLSSFKGKYILVDFWASWCGPCRAENPNVVKAYNKFKDKNFEIISISIDSDKKAWLKAVEEDKLPWLNLLDGQTAKQSIAMAYGVLAVPTNFLIDPSGKIIAKNLIGEKLHEKLTETLK